MTDNNEIWIKDYLVPLLVQNGKFSKNVGVASTSAALRNVVIRKMSLEESYMMNLCYKIKVMVGCNEFSETEEHFFVVKITPVVNEYMFKMMDLRTLFENEVIAYNEIFPALNCVDSYPKYYYSHIKENEAAIALSDFTVDGWQMSKSLVNLSLEHILVAVNELGKFHGSSYALKETNPVQFRNIITMFKESRYRHDTLMDLYNRRIHIAINRCSHSVRNSEVKTCVPEEFLRKLEKLMEDPYNQMKKMVKPKEPLAVICHGDYLRNNIAFKYADAERELPLQAMMFDFQTLRYASPMIDLTTFMANSTSVDVRTRHFDEIFKCYHDSLINQYCQSTGGSRSTLPEYFKYSSFLKEYATYLPYGMCIAGYFLHFLHDPVTDPHADLSDEEETEMGMTRGGEAVDRELRALVEDIYNLHKHLELELCN